MKATLLLLVFLSLMGRTTCVAEDQPASPNTNINILCRAIDTRDH